MLLKLAAERCFSAIAASFNQQTGQFQIEIKGLVEPKSKEALRICQEDLNEVIAAFVQDKTSLERGLFDSEMVPEELTQVRMGKSSKINIRNWMKMIKKLCVSTRLLP